MNEIFPFFINIITEQEPEDTAKSTTKNIPKRFIILKLTLITYFPVCQDNSKGAMKDYQMELSVVNPDQENNVSTADDKKETEERIETLNPCQQPGRRGNMRRKINWCCW